MDTVPLRCRPIQGHLRHLPSTLALLLILSQDLAVAQTREIRFERISLDRGLTDYRAFDLAQDSVGFLWFATSDGLYKYDGLGYTIYRPRLNDTTSLSSNTIWCLTTDRGGMLWIGTFDGGLECFDPRTETFTHYRNRPSDSSSISAGPLTTLLEDQTGTLWIGTERSGLNKFDRARGTFVHFIHDQGRKNSLSHNSIRAMCTDPSGTVWVGTDDGLNALNPITGEFRHYKNVRGVPRSISENAVTSLWCDRSGVVWVGTRTSGLNRFDRDSDDFTRYRREPLNSRSISCDSITAIYQNEADHLWIGTVIGLNERNLRTGACNRYLNDPLSPNSLSSNRVRKVAGDRTGTVWVATDHYGVGPEVRGLNKIVRNAEQFVYYRVALDKGGTLPVMALSQDPGTSTIWVGTKGLRQFNAATGKRIEHRHRPADVYSISDDLITGLCRDRSGTLWVGTWDGGLNRFDGKTGRFKSYCWNPRKSEAGNCVISISEDIYPSASTGGDSTGLWIGAFDDGILHFSASTGTFTRYKHDPSHPGSLGSDRVMVTYVDRKGVLWAGTDGGGLDKFDRSTGSFVHFSHDEKNSGSLRSNRVYALCEDPSSYAEGGAVLWVGTATGLDRFDAAYGTATHVSLQDTASAIGIMGIVPDRSDLWISTENSGLFRLSPRSGRSRNYTSEDGLYSEVFTRAAYRTSTGEILFGGRGGFVVFHPDSIKDNPTPPPIVLSTFSIFDRPHEGSGPIWTRQLIHLNYDQDFFSFRFLALDFTDPARNQFAYKLEGFDEDWNYPGTRNFAGYTKVDPGSYVFRVKGANSDGIWNEAGASITLLIDPPYWRTWWFRGLAGVLFLMILVGAYNYRVARLLEIERMRLRIASDLHDDIGSSLSGIALVTESMRKSLPIDEGDRKRLADVTQAARRTADALRDIVWIINPEHDTLDDMILRLKDAAAMILVGVEYTITSQGKSLSSTMTIEFKRHLVLIYKEILNNVVKHARARRVEISIGEEGGIFTLRVADDGIGFDEKTIRRGNGLDNLKKRGGMLGGTLRVESSPGKGTVVELCAKTS